MSNPAPCEFRRSVVLPSPIERVFAFHGDPRNVGKISPAWQSVRVLAGESVPGVGEVFEIEVRLFGFIPLRWRGVWRVVRSPALLVDEALSSPFAYWRHRHEFTALDDRHTRLTDHVTYRFHGGWLGRWFGESFGRIQFWLMFADRHRRTVRALS